LNENVFLDDDRKSMRKTFVLTPIFRQVRVQIKMS